jgi:hypothetical protein
MIDWKRPLTRLLVGDIFNATCPNGAGLICLVETVTDDRILARRVTTQDNIEFDRSTGMTLGSKTPCIIDSIAPLPLEIHNIMLGLDRKMRLQSDPEKFKLNKEEKEAILFVNEYYPLNPL